MASGMRTVLNLRCQFPFFQMKSLVSWVPFLGSVWPFPRSVYAKNRFVLSLFWVRFLRFLTHNPFICNKSLGSFPLN